MVEAYAHLVLESVSRAVWFPRTQVLYRDLWGVGACFPCSLVPAHASFVPTRLVLKVVSLARSPCLSAEAVDAQRRQRELLEGSLKS